MGIGGLDHDRVFDLSSYFAFFEWIWNGQTPGKRWLKLRVIREDGRPITFWEAAVRNLLRTFDMMPAPFYSIGLISVFSSSSISASATWWRERSWFANAKLKRRLSRKCLLRPLAIRRCAVLLSRWTSPPH